VEVTEEQRVVLERWERSRTVPVRQAERARMVLLSAQGWSDECVALAVGSTRHRVARWCGRFARLGPSGIERDAPRGGRPANADKIAEIVRLTTEARPQAATHWSTRRLAAEVGVSDTTVLRVWRARGLKPHLQRGFKVSNDPDFAAKLDDIVGLYLAPPEHAVVLSCDEKSQVQALDRTQPGLPLKPGRAGTLTHDYKRHGTTTLFAALNTLTGAVISTCKPRHRHIEWLQFLKLIDASVPADKQVHLICDNYATHKHAKVRAWLARRPRFHVHFTPTSASWLNMVERFFRNLASDRLKRGVFRSVDELIAAIDQFVAHHNKQPKPFIWTASAKDILAKVIRAQKKLKMVQTA
jgi:transposase